MAWTKEKLNEYIVLRIEESLTLDYKAAAALDSSKKAEITKDVSAMANSAGGTIIYGLAEDSVNKHLPGRIDPVDRTRISKEWLEQVINNIQPRIVGVAIHPILVDGAVNDVAYVVTIPPGETAHQASDYRYYRRFNFQSVPMYDYEIRDVMNRSRHPKISVECVLTDGGPPEHGSALDGPSRYNLFAFLKNAGPVYARFVTGVINVPRTTLAATERATLRRDNPWNPFVSAWNIGALCKEASLLPLLPGTSVLLLQLQLSPLLHNVLANSPDAAVSWVLYADNSRPRKGKVLLKDMPRELGEVSLFDEGEAL